MNMNENKIFWFFREPRSGSSWLSHALRHKLKRPIINVDPELFQLGHEMGISYATHRFQLIHEMGVSHATHKFQDSLGDRLLSGKLNYNTPGTCYATHIFEILTGLSVYKDPPIIIRSIRRNLTELILSTMAIEISKWRLVHMYKDPIKNVLPSHILHNLVKNPVLVEKPDLMKYMIKIKRRDELWDAYSNNFENYTIVYEDLEGGVNIPLYEGTIKFGDYDDNIIKTPDYKLELFSNYDQVVEWVNEFSKTMKIVR